MTINLIQPPKELRDKLLVLISELGATPSQIKNGEVKIKNAPIGTRNLYSIAKGYEVSYRSVGLLEAFFKAKTITD